VNRIQINKTEVDSVGGPLSVFATESEIIRISFGRKTIDDDRAFLNKHFSRFQEYEGHNEVSLQLENQLKEYSAGERREFSIPVQLLGTEFQVKVWRRLMEIPFGLTVSYQHLADLLSSSARAIGMANALNNLPILVPCHRVIASDAKLQGFAGGLPLKKVLLEHEGAWDSRLEAANPQTLF
jgi:O-6-methylguanine DNA methyltransferase